MTIVALPNGQNADFGDMPMDQIKAVLQKKFPAPQSEGLLSRAAGFADRNINQPVENNIVKPLNNIASGFNEGIANIPSGAANLGIWGANQLPGVNAKYVPEFNFAPNNALSDVGKAASFFAGPGAIKAGSSALRELPQVNHVLRSVLHMPLIAKGLQHATNLLKETPRAASIVKNSLLGGVYSSPGNEGTGLALGAAAPVVGDLAAGSINKVTQHPALQQFADKFMPEKFSALFQKQLGSGAENVEQNAKSLANDIRQGHSAREAEAGIFLDHALQQAGKEKIYEHVNPLISTSMDKAKDIFARADNLNIGDLYSKFKRNPSFENAHQLQSELGHWERELAEKPGKTPDERNYLQKVSSIRKTIKDDIGDFLKRRDASSNQNLSPIYQKGVDLYRENVAPYLSSKKLRDIVRGGKTSTKNIHSIFDTPSNILDKITGEEKIGSVNKLMQDLPEASKGKILYSAIGGKQVTANKLLEGLNRVENKGFSNYFTPEIHEARNALAKRQSNKKHATQAAKYAGVGTAAGLAGAAGLHFL